MSWSYASDFSTQRDRIRLLIGDTDSADPLLSDAEIAVYGDGGQLAQANDHLAAAACCEAIASKFARRVSLSAGGTSVALDQQARAYQERATRLRREADDAPVGVGSGTLGAPVFTLTTGDPA